MPKTKAIGDVVKTTVDLPRALWREAKVRGMDTGLDLRQIIIAALEAYLAKKGGTR
jgi:hypothetical protein